MTQVITLAAGPLESTIKVESVRISLPRTDKTETVPHGAECVVFDVMGGDYQAIAEALDETGAVIAQVSVDFNVASPETIVIPIPVWMHF